MKIHKLSATFGKLNRQTLELKDGLNIIEAPNESGKSTWAGFLRAMLYGIDTKARDRKGFIAEKNLYQPWDGGAMEGSMELSWKGREITLRRTSRGSSPMSQFQAVYTGTEEPVPGLTADSAGELLTGVGREVFERSAFLGQGALPVTGSAELEQRISALVSSGQEDVSFSETEQRLRDWKNRRQSNQKNGLIPRLEEEKTQVSALLTRVEDANRRAVDARIRIRALEEEQTELEQQAAAHRALNESRLRERCAAAQTERDAAQAALDSLRQERQRRGKPPAEETLREMQGELAYLNTLDANIRQARREIETTPLPSAEIGHPVFAGMEPAAARARAKADAAVLKKRAGTAPALIGALACVGLLLTQILLRGNAALCTALSAACAGVFCAAVIFFCVKLRGLMKQKSRIIASYGTQDGGGILQQAEDYCTRWDAVSQVHTEAAVRAVSLERLEAEYAELSERMLAVVRAFAPEVTDLYGVSAAVSLALSLNDKERSAVQRLESAEKVLQAVTAHGIPGETTAPERIPERSEAEISRRLREVQLELSRQNETLAMAQGQMTSLGDPAALQVRLDELEEALTQRRAEYQALLLAMDGLNEANAVLQSRMSPALNARAGELLCRLTGGQYDQVSLTREFDALAGRQGDVTPRRLLTLSRGTADQLYLAVRLAVCSLVLDGDDPAPLVLDDALVNFDDERLRLALELLRQLGAHRQILLFTCQSRERLCLNGAPDVFVTGLQS